MLNDLGATKLRDLITHHDVITTQSDSNSEGKGSTTVSASEQSNLYQANNNIGKTLDFLLRENKNDFTPQSEEETQQPK